jgi:hypothetical protein
MPQLCGPAKVSACRRGRLIVGSVIRLGGGGPCG